MGLQHWYAVAFKQVEPHLLRPQAASEVLKMGLEPASKLLEKIGNYHLDTLEHSLRSAFVAVDIANELRWSYEAMNELGYAAELHDVGKGKVPRRILDKAKKLTAKEKQKMYEHMGIGYHLTEGFSPCVRFTVLTHHDVLISDRRNGTERRADSRGDRRNEGPYIPTRDLVALCERHDALKFKRPYHTHTPEQVPKLLVEQYTGAQAFTELVLKRFYKREAFASLLRDVPT